MGYLERPSHVAFILVAANEVIAESKKQRWDAAKMPPSMEEGGQKYYQCTQCRILFAHKKIRRGDNNEWYCRGCFR